MNKRYKQYYLSEEDICYIKNYGKEKNLKDSPGLNMILREHQQQRDTPADLISKMVIETLKNDLTRIRIAANTADRNSQVIIEILNTIVLEMDIIEPILTTEFEAPTITIARNKVKDDIERYKQIKESNSPKYKYKRN